MSFSFIFLAPLFQTIGKTPLSAEWKEATQKKKRGNEFTLSRQLNFSCFSLRNIQMDVKSL
jgi:hypothetical protein